MGRILADNKPTFEELLTKMQEIHDKKAHDYSGKDDRFGNFRLAELTGIPMWHGIVIRLGDKFSRVCEFAKKGRLEVKDESIEDTLLDMANYSLLCLMAYYEEKEDSGR